MLRFWKMKDELRKANELKEQWKEAANECLEEKLDVMKKCSDLELKVAELQHILSGYEAFDNVNKESPLPKCESVLCRSCIHCQTLTVNGEVRIVGCRKDIECGEYKAAPSYVPIPYTVPYPNYNDCRYMGNSRLW